MENSQIKYVPISFKKRTSHAGPGGLTIQNLATKLNGQQEAAIYPPAITQHTNINYLFTQIILKPEF